MNNKIIVAILYVLIFAYLYSFQDYGFNIWDEGGYANGTLRTYNGQTAMKDFNPNGYLPGRYIYSSFFFHVFGVHIQSLRIAVALLTPGMVLMVYGAARRIMPSGFAFLSALATLSAPAMYYNRFFTLCTVFLVFAVSVFIRSKGTFQFVLFAFAVVVSGFIKIEVALFGAIIGGGVAIVFFFQGIWRNPFDKKQTKTSKWKFRVTISSLIIIFLVGVLFSLRIGLAGKVWDIVLKTHDVWGNPFPTLFPFFELLKKVGPHDMFERVLFYLPLVTYLLVLLILLVEIWRNRGVLSEEGLQTLSILSFGICAFGLVVWRAGFDNLLRTLPPFYILFCFLLSIFWREVLASQWFQKLALGQRTKRGLLNVCIVFLPFMYYFEMNTHHGFYAGSIGAMKHEKGQLRLSRLNVLTHPKEAQWLQRITSKIKLYSQKGDPIFAIPLNPVFYYLTDRVNPTPYDWILPGMLDKNAQAETVENLRANPPKLIIYVDIAIDGKEERRFANYAPIIFHYIRENYTIHELVGFFQVLIPKPSE